MVGFSGGFDGGGYAVRGLFINRGDLFHLFGPGPGNGIGLFASIMGPHEITDLGVEEADIRGRSDFGIGILAGDLRSDVRRVWTTGKVAGFGLYTGGLIGVAEANVYDSWSTADVWGQSYVGGLIGSFFGERGDFIGQLGRRRCGRRRRRRCGRIRGRRSSNAGSFKRNWSAGAVAGGAPNSGFSGGGNVSFSYWNADTSGVTISQGGGVTLSVVLQTLSSVAFGGAAATAWAFGDSVLSDTDGVADFPLLTVHDRPLQAVNLARALTRIMGVGDAATVHLTRRTSTRFLGVSDAAELMAAFAAETTVTTDGIRLDTNGLAADTGTGGTSIPNCFFDEGVLRGADELQRRDGQVDIDNGRKPKFRLGGDG